MSFTPDYIEETVLRGGVSLLGPLRVPRRYRAADPEPIPLSEHDHPAEDDPLTVLDHPAVDDPLTEARPLSGRNPRAAAARHSRLAIQRAGESYLSRQPFRERRTGDFVRAIYPVHLFCIHSRHSADLECGGVVGGTGDNRPYGGDGRYTAQANPAPTHAWLKRDPTDRVRLTPAACRLRAP